MTLKCFKCSAEVVFDAEHIGKNGKKIPLDPATKQPHDCPMREKRTATVGESTQLERVDIEAKEDHGNESFNAFKVTASDSNQTIHDMNAKLYALKGQSKVKIFFGNFAPDVEEEYNEFLRLNKIKTQGAQFQISNTDDQSMLFAIALYYEEVAKQ